MKNSKGITWVDPVTFNGETYTRRIVHVKGFGDRVIAGETLQKVLLTEDGNYVSEEAQAIDQNIFFYVEDKYLNFTDTQLADFVASQVA